MQQTLAKGKSKLNFYEMGYYLTDDGDFVKIQGLREVTKYFAQKGIQVLDENSEDETDHNTTSNKANHNVTSHEIINTVNSSKNEPTAHVDNRKDSR